MSSREPLHAVASPPAAEVDPVLHAYLAAPAGSLDEEHALRDLLELAGPVVQSVLRSKARQNVLAEPLAESDQQELQGDALLKVVRRVQQAKSDRAAEPIANFSGYVAVITYNTFHAHMRQKYPERQRLRNRIRYVLRTSKRHAVWTTPYGDTLCGRAAWENVRAAAPSNWEAPADPSVPPVASVDDITPPILLRALDALFDAAAAPVELDQLVKAAATYLRLPIGSQRSTDLEDVDLVDAAPSPEQALLGRSALTFLWSEIAALPERQRAALLLNLRDANGAGVISLLIMLAVATFEEVAAAVGMTSDELTAIWNDLPIDDLTIAERFGTTRQQVINLRKSARERLGRRMRSSGQR